MHFVLCPKQGNKIEGIVLNRVLYNFVSFSCCIDEVAAEHVNADLIIHYGRACLSQ